jgi:hypothetical protein
MSFKDDVEKFSKLVERRLQLVARNSIGYLAENVILKTPVDSPVGPNGEEGVWYDTDDEGNRTFSVGEARGSWTASKNAPAFTTTLDPEGNSTTRRAWSVFRGYQPRQDNSLHLSNNTPYITTLEFGGYQFKEHVKSTPPPGSRSWQAPQGMMRVHTNDWRSYVKDAVFEARSIR